jgi:hypothetical protein
MDPCIAPVRSTGYSPPTDPLHVGQGEERDSYFDVATDIHVRSLLFYGFLLLWLDRPKMKRYTVLPRPGPVAQARDCPKVSPYPASAEELLTYRTPYRSTL